MMPIITMIIIRLQWFTLLASVRCPTTILMTTCRMFDRVTAEQRHCLTIIMTITLTDYTITMLMLRITVQASIRCLVAIP